MCRLTAFKLVASALVVLLTGCATLQQRASPSPPATFDRSADEQSCIDWLASLDAAIAETGVGDAEAVRLPDFPHLRMNRFLASFRDELDSQQKWAAWLQRLTQLGAQRRGVEIANLPAAAVTRLAANRTAALSRCAAAVNCWQAPTSHRLRVLRPCAVGQSFRTVTLPCSVLSAFIRSQKFHFCPVCAHGKGIRWMHLHECVSCRHSEMAGRSMRLRKYQTRHNTRRAICDQYRATHWEFPS